MKRTLIPALLAVLAVVLAAGCGGGGSEEKASGTTTTATVERTPTATETTGTLTTSPEPTGTNVPSLSKSCRDLEQLTVQLQQTLSGPLSAERLQATTKLLDAYAENAPVEIRDDIRVYADYWSRLVAALKGVDLRSDQPPSPEVLQRLQKVEREFGQAKLQRAGQNIGNWARKNCSG